MGALVFWCDNEPLNYQANLFLETVEFPGGKNVNHIKFEGNHKGEQIMIPGNINIEKKRVFNNKRKFSDGKTERFSLAHNLVNIYEGKTISYVDPKIDMEHLFLLLMMMKEEFQLSFILLIMNMKIKKIL